MHLFIGVPDKKFWEMIADVEKKGWSSCGSGRLAGLPLRVHSHSCSLSESQRPDLLCFPPPNVSGA